MEGKITIVKCGCGQTMPIGSYDMMFVGELEQKDDYCIRSVMCTKCHKTHKVRISVKLLRNEYEILTFMKDRMSVLDCGTLMGAFNQIYEGCTIDNARSRMIPVMMIVKDSILNEEVREMMNEITNDDTVTDNETNERWYDFIGWACDTAYGEGYRTYEQ